jgi:large subunit ribosomal protein L30
MAATRHFAVSLKRSAHHWPETQRKTLESLGLSRFGKVVYVKDTPAVRGMLYKVVHAVEVTAHAGPPPQSHRALRKKAPRADKATTASA